MISWFTLLLLLPLVSASILERRTTKVCGQYDSVAAGSYSLLNNLWGESSATSGSQCSVLKSADGDTVTWYTHWTWSAGAGVKSFSNIQLNTGINQQLGVISTMQSEWHWSQENTGSVVADVAYDFFTAYSPGGSDVNEIMVWLAVINSGPISNDYDYSGHAVPVATNLCIVDHSWNLYRGSNGYNEVYSFLPVEGSSITTFSGDMYEFFTYLTDAGYIASSEYLVTAQAGTEATSGTGVFKTSAYSLTIK